MGIKLDILGQALKKAEREHRVINMHTVAKETGITYTTIYKYCTKQNIESYDNRVLAKLCEYFGCDISGLLKYVPDENAAPELGAVAKLSAVAT